MADMSHVLVKYIIALLCNYTSDYSFGAHAGIVHLIKFKLVSFQLAPSLNIAHFSISARA